MSLSYLLFPIKMQRFYQNLLVFIVGTIILEVCSQCCLSFDGNKCIGCPAGMRLIQGNCIYNIPNCVGYYDDFYCNQCAQAYVSTSNRRNCILKTNQTRDLTQDTPNKGFRVPSNSDQLDKSIQTIFNASKKYFEKEIIRSILKVYTKQYNNQQEQIKYEPSIAKLYRYYRFIFLCSRSVIQAIFLYVEPNDLSVKEELRVLHNKTFIFSDKERDGGWSTDPYKDKIIKQIKQRYPAFMNYEFIYGVKYKQRTSPSTGPAYTYRVFVTIANPYLQQVSVTTLVNISSVTTMKQPQVLKNSTLKELIDKINLPPNFSFDTLTITDYMSQILYNLTLVDKSITISQQSYFYLIFLVSKENEPILIQFSQARDQLISLQLGERSSDKNFSAFTSVSDRRLRIIPNWFLKKGQANNEEIDPDFQFVELLDLDDFINSNVFRIGFRTVSTTYYFSQFLQENIVRVVIGQNSSMLIYQTAYETVNPKRQLIYYIFSITKEYREFQMIKIYTVNRKDWEVFMISNDSSREQSLQRIQNRYQQFKPIIQEIGKTRPQLTKSQIFSVRIEQYYNKNNELVNKFFIKYNVVNKELIKKELKQNKTASSNISNEQKYEYLELRYEVIQGSISRKYLGQVFVPLEVFLPVKNITQFKDYLTLAYSQFKQQDLSELEASQSRSNQKRFKFTLNQTTQTIKYYIDEFQNLIVLSSQKKESTKAAVKVRSKRSIAENSTNMVFSSLTSLKVETNETKNIETKKNETSLVSTQKNTNKASQTDQIGRAKLSQNFPTKTLKSLWKQPEFPSYLSFIYFIQQYTNEELRKLISKFLKTLEKQIGEIQILQHETLYYILDSYTVKFSQPYSRLGSQKKIFSFQVPRKIYLNSDSQQIRRFLQAQTIQNNKPNQEKTKLKTFLKNSQLKILSNMFNRQFIRFDEPELPGNFPIISSSVPEQPQVLQELQNFLKQVPQIAPIFYSEFNQPYEKINFNLSEPFILSESTQIKIKNDPLTKESLNNLLLELISERSIQSMPQVPQVSMLNLNHQYFGQIKALYSNTYRQISDIYFIDEGYQIRTNDSNLITSIPEISEVYLNSSSQINKILNKRNYTEGGKLKNLTIGDVLYWKAKKVNTIFQYEFIYELQGFIITSGAIVKPKKAEKSQIFLTNLEIVQNNPQKRKRQQKKLFQLNRIRRLPEFIQIQIKINSSYGHYLKDFLILNVSVISNTSQSIVFSLNYLGKSVALNTVALLLYSSKQVKIIQFKTLQRKRFYGEGCKLEKQNSYCQQCQNGYFLSKKDNTCYKIMANCVIQSSQLCLQCKKSYILRNYECI